MTRGGDWGGGVMVFPSVDNKNSPFIRRYNKSYILQAMALEIFVFKNTEQPRGSTE